MFNGRVKFQFQLASLELRIVRLGIFAPPTNKVPNVCRLILGDTVFHKQVDFFRISSLYLVVSGKPISLDSREGKKITGKMESLNRK